MPALEESRLLRRAAAQRIFQQHQVPTGQGRHDAQGQQKRLPARQDSTAARPVESTSPAVGSQLAWIPRRASSISSAGARAGRAAVQGPPAANPASIHASEARIHTSERFLVRVIGRLYRFHFFTFKNSRFLNVKK